MEAKVIGSTNTSSFMTKEEAILFAGHEAGICYTPSSFDKLFSEDIEKTRKRAINTLKSGHHSVYDHIWYNLSLEGIPKILAIILNNQGIYATSERSARHVKLCVSEREKSLYEKWIDKYTVIISDIYPNLSEKKVKDLALENARYLVSVFCPYVSMGYTINLRQLNYIISSFNNFINTAESTSFNEKLKNVFREFIDMEVIQKLTIPELNMNNKRPNLTIFSDREYVEEFGECYCTSYRGSFSEFAQAQRHRTLRYSFKMYEFLEQEKPLYLNNMYYVPCCIQWTKVEKEWLNDMQSLEDLVPQGTLIKITEKGTVEDFVLKCTERLCGYAQLEIMKQTKKTLNKYIETTKNTNLEVYNYLEPYSHGARCTFPNWKCNSPCIWGGSEAFKRLV